MKVEFLTPFSTIFTISAPAGGGREATNATDCMATLRLIRGRYASNRLGLTSVMASAGAQTRISFVFLAFWGLFVGEMC